MLLTSMPPCAHARAPPGGGGGDERTIRRELLNFWDHKFADDNGVHGKFPVLPDEWKAVGLDSDANCFKLLEYLYRTDDNGVPVYDVVPQAL